MKRTDYTGWATFDDLTNEYAAVIDAAIAEAYPRGQYKLTRMGDDTGDTLSRVVSALATASVNLGECIDDVHRWHAPSECVGVVVKAFTSKVQEIVERFGYDDVEQVWEALGQRCSYRMAYDLLGEAMVH